MSLGYGGRCKLAIEDEFTAGYAYSGENLNDGGKSETGDALLYDGEFTIKKTCLEEPEIHETLKKMPSGRKKLITKRITHVAAIGVHLADGDIVIDRECKNAFRHSAIPADYIACRLLLRIFEAYQETGSLPEKEAFIQ